jgi:hypothetical protein
MTFDVGNSCIFAGEILYTVGVAIRPTWNPDIYMLYSSDRTISSFFQLYRL